MRESLRRLASDDVLDAKIVSGKRRVRIELQDGEYITIDIDRKARGSDLLDLVCMNVDVEERDYFGLLHTQRGDPRVWVDLNRRLAKTFRNEPWDVRFCVRFYPPEPALVSDEHARYQLALAVRNDIAEGRISCSMGTQALLASLVLQAERGDRAGAPPPTALAQLRAAPLHTLTTDLQEKVDQLYARHKGQSPAEAELQYLEAAKRLPLYGAECHAAADSQGAPITLAVCATGLSVYRDSVVLNRFPWAMILKLSYDKRCFTVRLRAGECDLHETDVCFHLPSTRACKKLWRCSVEHHIFFRREAPVSVSRVRGFPRLGSRRVSCRRTLRQLRDAAHAQLAQPITA